jgi:hypothetical protein
MNHWPALFSSLLLLTVYSPCQADSLRQFPGKSTHKEECDKNNRTIAVIINNKTDQEFTLAAEYNILHSKHPGLADMPNPFVFKNVTAHQTSTINLHYAEGGRLGIIKDLSIRYPSGRDYKKFSGKEILKDFDKLTGTYILEIVISKNQFN